MIEERQNGSKSRFFFLLITGGAVTAFATWFFVFFRRKDEEENNQRNNQRRSSVFSRHNHIINNNSNNYGFLDETLSQTTINNNENTENNDENDDDLFDNLNTPEALMPLIRSDSISVFPLISKRVISHNSVLFSFQLPSNRSLGLPLGQHIVICAEINGEIIRRPYTPITTDRDVGHFDILVKIYPRGVISPYLNSLPIGDCVSVSGPRGKFLYEANRYDRIGMVAGGSGITPMFQIIKGILHNPFDRTMVSLIYANVTEDDILLRGELDAIAASDSRITVFYVLNEPPQDWSHGVGFVTREMIQQYCPPPPPDSPRRMGGGGGSGDHASGSAPAAVGLSPADAAAVGVPVRNKIKLLFCGPPPMVDVMMQHAADLGYPRKCIYKF